MEGKSEKTEDLRRRAEEQLNQSGASIESMPDADIRALLHELQVHQIELEMQNEELLAANAEIERLAKAETEDARRRYSDLYNFAPVGYLTIDDKGIVVETNLTAGDLLGLARSALIKTPFQLLVSPQSHSSFETCRKTAIQTGVRQSCEMVLLRGRKETFHALVEIVTTRKDDGASSDSLMTITDISGLKQTQELLEREHRIAEVLQRALISDTGFDIPGFEIAVRYEPALKEAEVGGDFYDAFDLGDGKVGIVIGDVVGKGLPAAVGVAAAKHSIRSYAYIDPRPSRVMTLSNEAMCRENKQIEDLRLLTAFFTVIDTRLGGMVYANGGHEPPVVRSANGGIERLELPGRALGIEGDFDYKEAARKLQSGDAVVLVTDGITEARPDVASFFGLEGVEAYLARNLKASPEEIASGIIEAAKAHTGGPLKDDAAVVVFGLRT